MRQLLVGLLVLSLAAFTGDLFHWFYHLFESPRLWTIEGVPIKTIAKVASFLLPLFLLVCRRHWQRWLLLFFIGVGAFLSAGQISAQAASGCKQAPELFERSGVARDASENLFGKIKLTSPYGSFPPEMDKITWWGEFQPFEFWENPVFEATWINPHGKTVAKQKFRGNKCKLAKTTLYGRDQSRGQFEAGLWNVVISCEGQRIDQQSFVVLPPAEAAPGAPDVSSGKETAVIWVDEELK